MQVMVRQSQVKVDNDGGWRDAYAVGKIGE
jgi:hypothetical protein